MRILYGTSSNPNEMELLVNYPNMGNDYAWEWIFHLQALMIETPGNYYFAFNFYQAPGAGWGGMMLDKIEIGQGAFQGVPDIEVIRGLAPVSGCGMTNQETLGVELHNKGTTTIEEFTLTYQVGSTTPVSQTYNQTIGLNASVKVYFDQKADFSTLGEYSILFTASTPGEENMNDNEAELINVNLTPNFSSLPVAPLVLEFNASTLSGGNDAMDITILISDSTFAWDRLDDGHFHNAIGLDGRPGALGLIYELQKKDKLTSITVGLIEFDIPILGNIGLAVYEVNDNLEVGSMLFEVEHPRTNGNDEEGITFNVPDTELTPGKYYFELRQIDKMFITNVVGKIVHTASNINDAVYSYNTMGLNPGIYFISIQTQTGIISSKFVVK
ncbi:MAG: T9SS type A sorting domain-containing protein [Bacteroidetes bacterium]|nr:T9SS type A sorting domain-containing protein [Bacteroidota bacterium]MCL2302705.1 T9SS type A sorting domain-containing protein [Lentimicrobiaceae bacterium]